MTRILIPRSDNSSAKTVEASDFEKYFNDFLCDYIICGLTITAQCPNILAVDVSSGNARIGGLHLNNSVSCAITCLTACNTNYIYATICRDPSCEPQGWIFSSNTTGCTPADSMVLGTATTNATTVTAVNQIPETCLCCGVTGLRVDHGLKNLTLGWFGNGCDGDVTISCNTTLTQTQYYKNLTVNACVTLDSSTSPQVIFVRDTLTVNGTLQMNPVGACGGAGGAGGTSPAGNGTNGTAGCAATNFNISGGAGGTAASSGCGGTAPGGCGTAGGGSGAGGNGGGSGSPPGPTPGSAGVTSTATGGAGGPTGTRTRKLNNLTEYLSCQTNLLAAGGGGGGGAAAGGAGGNGGESGISPPTGGFGGAGGTGAVGGAGGKGGGTLILVAQNIVVGACGTIQALGGDGSSGGNASNGGNGSCNGFQDGGGGGGGGGGAGGAGTGGGGGGGVIGLYYYTLTNNGTISAAGGAGGLNSSSGGSGGSGGDGGPNPDGGPGQAGGAGAGATGPSEANGSSGTAGLILNVPLK